MITKRQIAKILSNCRFDPKEGVNKIFVGVDNTEYYRLRAIEELSNQNTTIVNVARTIQLLVILIWRMQLWAKTEVRINLKEGSTIGVTNGHTEATKRGIGQGT